MKIIIILFFISNFALANGNNSGFESANSIPYVQFENTNENQNIVYFESHNNQTTFESFLSILDEQSDKLSSNQQIVLAIDFNSVSDDEIKKLELYLIEHSIKNITLVSTHSSSPNPSLQKSNFITPMSVGVALIKSTMGTTYYFHYLPFEPALIGSLFSTIHNLIFTANPIGEQKYLLNPLKEKMGMNDLLSRKAQHFDLIASTVHKLLNLGIVSTIINWEQLSASSILFDATTSAIIYTLIKNFWKIHFDYQLKLQKISEKTYKYTIPILELAAYGIMPGIMLNETWAISAGAFMGTTGAISYLFNPKLTKKNQVIKKLKCVNLYQE